MEKATPKDHSAPEQPMCPIHNHPYWPRRNVRTGELSLACLVCDLEDLIDAGQGSEAGEPRPK